MKQTTYYVTTGQVERFAVGRFRQTGERLRFPEVIKLMQARGLLSRTPLPLPDMDRLQTRAQFSQTLLELPLCAAAPLKRAETSGAEPVISEQDLFSQARDMHCILNLPCMSDDPHAHQFFEIDYVQRGSFSMLFDRGRHRLGEGDLCILAPGAFHSHPVEPGGIVVSFTVRSTTFDGVFGDLLVNDDLESGFFRDALYGERKNHYLLLHTDPEDERLQWYMQSAVRECHTDDPHANTCAVSLLKLFLAQVFRNYGASASIYPQNQGKKKPIDSGAMLRYIQQNYRTVTLGELAEVFHYNGAYLSRVLQRDVGQGFTELVRSLRLARGEKYLLHSGLGVSEIAELVGYRSVDHFTRTFRKEYGMSPQHYRREHRREDGESRL